MSRAVYHAKSVPGATLVYDDYSDASPTMTVTNDAEAVVAEVAKAHGDARIAYLDTDGRWDELRHDAGVFRGFAPLDDELRAIVEKNA